MPRKQDSSSSKAENASLKSLTIQVKEIRRLLLECSEKKKAAKKMEKRRAKAMFGGDQENASPAEVNKKKEGQQQPQRKKPEEDKEREGSVDVSETAPLGNGGKASDDASDQSDKVPYQRKSSLNAKKDAPSPRPTARKSVSFSQRPPQVKEFESSTEDDEKDGPWYSEHKEALIMLAVAGFSAAALIALRKSFR